MTGAHERARVATIALLSAALALGACGATARPRSGPPPSPASGASATVASGVSDLAPDLRPVPAGRGSRFALAPVSAAVASRAPVGALRCVPTHHASYGAHLELYANGLVLPVPAGIGIAPPQRRRGVYVLGGACSYTLRTHEPTGLIVLDRGGLASGLPSLGDLFALWGQSLTSHRLASFRGSVLAVVDGRRWSGPPGAIPLRRHAEIVLEVGRRVPPHRRYLFPPGL